MLRRQPDSRPLVGLSVDVHRGAYQQARRILEPNARPGHGQRPGPRPPAVEALGEVPVGRHNSAFGAGSQPRVAVAHLLRGERLVIDLDFVQQPLEERALMSRYEGADVQRLSRLVNGPASVHAAHGDAVQVEAHHVAVVGRGGVAPLVSWGGEGGTEGVAPARLDDLEGQAPAAEPQAVALGVAAEDRVEQPPVALGAVGGAEPQLEAEFVGRRQRSAVGHHDRAAVTLQRSARDAVG